MSDLSDQSEQKYSQRNFVSDQSVFDALVAPGVDVQLVSVHTRSELSDQIAGSHSLSMGKSDQSDQSDQRYQRPKLSDQSVKKKLKTF